MHLLVPRRPPRLIFRTMLSVGASSDDYDTTLNGDDDPVEDNLVDDADDPIDDGNIASDDDPTNNAIMVKEPEDDNPVPDHKVIPMMQLWTSS